MSADVEPTGTRTSGEADSRRWLQTREGWVRCDLVVSIRSSYAYDCTVVENDRGQVHKMPKGMSPTETLVALLDASEADIRKCYAEEQTDAR